MRPIRLLVQLAALIFSALPAAAVTLEQIDLNSDSVTLTITSSGDSVSGPPPQSLPLADSTPDCLMTGTATFSVVDGELELAISGSFTSEPNGCRPEVETVLTIGFTVPDFGGAMTTVVFEAVESWSGSEGVNREFGSERQGLATSSLLGGDFPWADTGDLYLRDGDQVVFAYLSFIAGDSVSVTVHQVTELFSSDPLEIETVNATYRVKAFAVKPTLLPEPSVSLGTASGVALLGALKKLRESNSGSAKE